MPRTHEGVALPVAGSGRRLAPLPARCRRGHSADVRAARGQHRPHAVRAGRQRARHGAQRLGPEPRAGLRVRGRRGAGPDRRRARVHAAAGRDGALDRRQPVVGVRPLRHGRGAVPVPGRRRLARLLPLRLPLPRAAPARQRARPASQRLARRVGRDPLGRRHRRHPRRGAGPRRRRGEPGGRADERRLPARRPAAARPHRGRARPPRAARRAARGRCWRPASGCSPSPTRSTSRASPPTPTPRARCSTRCGSWRW